MSVEGVWTLEVYGPFGWDNRGVFVLDRGRILGGDNRQYTVGDYQLANADFSANLNVHYYGPPRTDFGEAREQFDTVIAGKLSEGVIEGSIGRRDRPQFDLQIRLTKRMELPD
ncbi:type III secretion system (T3SS) negative regulator GrlR [Aliiruegeria haliotis]|uniref:Type III secretion system (T3SS) negative regulator GrlR n=1 Tax=Aliiruegeria haliotis TaxID=1280846 RepID=A0A2T0RHX7_9RHOB|nr:GrlR family regulatory protein [Aliiruegeria haliotis]PRY20722.1 type III secretion system (T3SS) negative regulator GrlR [Aliiruegeria haliotis]